MAKTSVPHSSQSHRDEWVRIVARLAGAALLFTFLATTAHATLPPWLQHIVGASTAEAALYRLMHLPGADTLYPRPPKESQTELATLIQSRPNGNQPDPDLYALRARADEQALDLPAAESDWKLYATQKATPQAQLELANFYSRRLQTEPEAAVLKQVAAGPVPASDQYLNPQTQLSWRTFIRLINLLNVQAAPEQEVEAAYQSFEAHYPTQPSVYAHELQFLLDVRDYPQAEALITRYHAQNPADITFPIRAHALIVLRRDGPDQALAVYDSAFQPLWPQDLVQSYFALLAQTHHQRAFVDAARAKLNADPGGPAALNALARVFFYDQQASRIPQAQLTLDQFRVTRESRNLPWSPVDLYTLAQLSALASNSPEVARYNFALASTPGALPDGEPAAQSGLAALTHLLLAASNPDSTTTPYNPANLALGAGNLSLYRDIATLDQGPGYWNGILSLWLNGTNPASEYDSETARAQTYFHRSKAAELLAESDSRFPLAPQRASLHAELIAAQAQYGEPAAVVAAGKAYLAAFPANGSSPSSDRITVAGLLADAYANQKDTASEFALYDSLLAELAAQTHGQPLTAALATTPGAPGLDSETWVSTPATTTGSTPVPASTDTSALTSAYTPTRTTLPAANQYQQILDRYLARLVAARQIPQALTLLRRELDRNPADPALYERLADFLQQNDLAAQQGEVYKLAIARFQQPTYYDKLARFYLREKQRQAFATLTKQVVDIFSGTDLDKYFALVTPADTPTDPGPQLALQLNLYAQHRFPHDLVFTRNLLTAYTTGPVANPKAYDALIRRQWYTSEDLTTQFLEYLSRTNKLQAELAALQPTPTPGAPGLASETWVSNPAQAHELSGLEIFQSHYEQASAPLTTLTALYPADPTLNDQAISLFRSLSYLDPTPTTLGKAVSLEQNLLTAAPDSPDRLATLGDLYAEATAFRPDATPAALAQASPNWRRIPSLHPGTPAGFLTSATIFWDYFQFTDALAEIHTARTRFSVPTLYGYEAGAIEENRHDPQAAIAQYVAVAIQPTGRDSEYPQVQSALAWAAIDALLVPPSDAADSNLQSALQAFFGTEKANRRLVELARRPATAALVDQATMAALNAHPTDPAALTLRADVLTAEHRGTEIAPLLSAALARAQTEDQAEAIGTLAQSHSLTPTYEAALARQAALTIDPVQKIQLEYTLAASLEARKQTAQAQAIYASVYTANPRLLGVVRATTDFYARTRQPALAINTLLDAAKSATPNLARAFTLEAATRANDANNPAQARQLALTLLPASPYDPQVLAVIAASYAKANDPTGLKTFYLAEIQSATAAPNLSRDDRKNDIALLRRGLIPALTQLKDYEGAENQYIALLSAFPEDLPTTQQAALYAIRYNRQAPLETQLVAFLETTVKQSPQDSRFAIDLAQVQTTFGNLPAALAAYDAAITVRKDRADLYQNRAQLELQLAVATGTADNARLDAAADDFTHLYALTYHDPQWQVRIAEIRVRQSRPADAVKSLRIAYIDGHPPTGPIAAANTFTVAAQLAQWNLLAEARTYAEQGIHLAGPTLLTNADTTGAQTYARVLTRLGHPELALSTLTAARRAALAVHPAGYADATDDETRKGLIDQQTQTVTANLNTAVAAIGSTVKTFYTPEQRQSYALTLDTLHTTDARLAIQAAATAALADREAAWRKQQIITAPADADATTANLAAYRTLQTSRLAFADLARTLEAYAARLTPDNRAPIRQQAATAFGNAGDIPNEIRITRTLAFTADPTLRDHFLDLLLTHNPAALAALAAGKDASLADAAVNYTVAHGTFQQTSVVLGARGKALPAVWIPANLALAGLYLQGDRSVTNTAFTQSLRANDTVAQHLATRANPKATLTGDLWFDEAARFGLFLNLAPATPATDAEDYLPAGLESSPSSSGEYLDLARTYAEARNVPAARAEFAHVLELAPTGSDAIAAHDEQAVLLQQTGNQTAAVAEWRAGLDLLRQLGDQSYPERFYTGFLAITHHLALNHLNLHAELEAVLRPYLARNGNYRSNELLHAAYDSTATPADGIAFVISLADAAADPDQVLRDLETAPWLPEPQLETLLLRRLDLASRTAPTSADTSELFPDDGANQAATGKRAIQQKLALAYLETANYAKLTALLDSIPTADRTGNTFLKAELLLAAHNNTLAARLLADSPTQSASLGLEPYTEAATFLAAPHNHAAPTPADLANALLLDQFLFDRDQAAHALTTADFLTLAQAHLSTNDLPGAVEILHRLALQPGSNPGSDPATNPGAPGLASETWVSSTANIDAAAALLESTHHLPEAVPFLQTLAASVPWSAAYRLRLAEAQQATTPAATPANDALTAIAKDPTAPYATRAEAAEHLKQTAPQDLGSAELNLLAQSAPSPVAAADPGFTTAQLYLAGQHATTPAERVTLLHQALAAAPIGLTADTARLSLLLAEAATPTPAPDEIALRNLVLNAVPASATDATDDTAADDSTPDTPDDAAPDATTPDTDATPPATPNTAASPDPYQSAVGLPALALTLDLPTQIHLAETLSQLALIADRNPQQALAYLQLALHLDLASPTPDSTLKPRLAALRAQIALDKLNTARRPVFHTDLTQKIAVRPRLTLAEAARLEAQ